MWERRARGGPGKSSRNTGAVLPTWPRLSANPPPGYYPPPAYDPPPAAYGAPAYGMPDPGAEFDNRPPIDQGPPAYAAPGADGDDE